VDLHGLLRDSLTSLCINGVCTSQGTHLWAFTAWYEDSFTILYVDRVRTSQETPVDLHGLLRDRLTSLCINGVCTSQGTHLWASTACYRDSFTILYVDGVRTSHKHVRASVVCYGDSFTLAFQRTRLLVTLEPPPSAALCM
jgi:hypothetical protein